MSDQPKNEKKKKARNNDSSTLKGFRKFLMLLLSLLAIAMTLMVLYMLKYGKNDPTTSEGKYDENARSATEAVTEITEATEATEATEETEPVDPLLYAAQQKLESMTLEEKVYQLFFVTHRELTGQYLAQTAGEETREALENKPVGGIVFDDDNIYDRDQLTAMISDMKSYSDIPLLVGIEEEGGTEGYRILQNYGITGRYDPMGVYGSEYDTERVYEIGNEIGTAITGVGFNIDLAPVADTLANQYNTEIGIRAFSADPQITAELVTQLVKGLHSADCLSCLKYFPGLSASNVDSRYGMAVSNQTIEEIRNNLLPFTTGIANGADMIMVSHLCLPNLVGENKPADLCPEIVNALLRGELGYEGVVMTDSFQKGAISYNYDIGEAAVAAIQAGCDVIYRPDDLDAAAQAILNAVDNGILSEERIDQSVLRILLLKLSNELE